MSRKHCCLCAVVGLAGQRIFYACDGENSAKGALSPRKLLRFYPWSSFFPHDAQRNREKRVIWLVHIASRHRLPAAERPSPSYILQNTKGRRAKQSRTNLSKLTSLASREHVDDRIGVKRVHGHCCPLSCQRCCFPDDLRCPRWTGKKKKEVQISVHQALVSRDLSPSGCRIKRTPVG